MVGDGFVSTHGLAGDGFVSTHGGARGALAECQSARSVAGVLRQARVHPAS